MSSPRHSPPPSAQAPRPRGILKNGVVMSGGVESVPNATTSTGNGPTTHALDDAAGQPYANSEEEGAQNRLAWDEGNLILHEMQREQQDPRMKIDEPKTPFVHSASLGPMLDDGAFDLDNNEQASGSMNTHDIVAANTMANANRRSPSFTLPDGRRKEIRDGLGPHQNDKMDEEESDEAPTDPEEKAKHDTFARKRNAHYGNEAEAMKIAAALAAKDDEEEEEEEDDVEEAGEQEAHPSHSHGSDGARMVNGRA